MKKTITLSFLSFLFALTVGAQERNCYSMENLEYRKQQDPGLEQRMFNLEQETNRIIAANQANPNRRATLITIPVVVHVLYSNSNENISDAQIQSQIDVLNEDFRRLNSDADNTWSQATDVEIEFCMATIDPNGNSTNGITRKSSTRATWGTNDAMKRASQGGVNPWPVSDYLNMWVCNIGGGILGYAQFPGGSAATDGVVMGTQYFGSKDKGNGFFLAAPFDLGRTATHEVGHYLNLRHIWGDANCGDDFVGDTPTQQSPSRQCPVGNNSCGSVDMVQNYMDYSDDACMNLFTVGQKNRMRAVLESGGFRASLANSNKCGTVTGPTCDDGIQNGNETGVDCGGSCEPCSTGNQYCESKSTNTNDEYIGRVQLGTINKTSGAQFYSDFTATSSNLSKGSSYTLTVTPTWTGTVYPEGYAAWIDYNDDGDFTDAGERVISIAATRNTPASASFTVPSGTSNGEKRLRVSMKYNGVPSPCETFQYGEVEDYTVVIEEGSTDICDGIAEWVRGRSYSVGDRVTYFGNLYERAATRWNLIGPCGNSRDNVVVRYPGDGILSIYPNPVDGGTLYVESNSQNLPYTIVNMLGQRVAKGITKSNAINVEDLEIGLYIIQFNINNSIEVAKFIKK